MIWTEAAVGGPRGASGKDAIDAIPPGAPAADDAIPPGVPAAEVAISTGLVRELLRGQYPDLRELPLRHLGAGWDNELFRLGEELVVRLPRRAIAVDLIHNEQRWLPLLKPGLPLPVSAPVHCGAAGAGYPWPWSIVPWFAGASAQQQPLGGAEPERLGEFLAALHKAAPADAPGNPVRGVPLVHRRAAVETRLARVRQTGLVTPRVLAHWQAALASPADDRRVWLHGDLHPGNLIVAGGQLRAVIDWGDICAGDPATDLASLWMLFDASQRASALRCYAAAGVSAQLLCRARGWAVMFAVMLIDADQAGQSAHRAVGIRTLGELAGDKG